MKIKIFIIILMLLPKIMLSQTTQTEVVPGGGGTAENSEYKNFGTFGQPAANESENSEYKNMEGFLNAQSPSLPVVLSVSINEINPNTVKVEGNMVDMGFAQTVYGFVWSTAPTPELVTNESGRTADSTALGTFIHELTGLDIYTTYYIRAYATNEVGTVYGNEMIVTTIPTLGEWGVISMLLLLAGLGSIHLWKKTV